MGIASQSQGVMNESRSPEPLQIPTVRGRESEDGETASRRRERDNGRDEGGGSGGDSDDEEKEEE